MTEATRTAAFDAAHTALQSSVPPTDLPQVAELVVDVLSRYHRFVAVEQARREWPGTLRHVSTTTLTAAVGAAANAMEEER